MSNDLAARTRYRWLVTGGAGFFGIHMCRGLAAKNQEVICYDTASIPPEEHVGQITEIKGDIRDTDRLQAALSGVDFVIHSAAALALAPPKEINEVNAEGTRQVLECSAKANVRRVVHVGTTAVYGMPKYHPIYEDAPLDPMGDYGIAKAKAETYCQTVKGIETVRIRPKSFIGSGRLGIFQVLFDWIECGKRIYVLGDGNNRFQLMEVRDLVEACYLAALKGESGEVYNIGAGDFGTVNEDLGALLEHAGTGSRICHIPSRPTKAVLAVLEALHISPIYRWVYDTADQDSFVSTEKAQQKLGWTPRFSNKQALISTYDWYLKEGKEMARKTGTGHRVAWKQGILKIIKALS
jgi:nucleoside-diphosphate-sugar epimerase